MLVLVVVLVGALAVGAAHPKGVRKAEHAVKHGIVRIFKG